MSDKNSTNKAAETDEKFPKKLPAVTTVEQAVGEAAVEAASEEEVAAPETDIEDDGVDELPEGVTLVGGHSSLDATVAAAVAPTFVPIFADDHAGQGGSYAIGEDGIRRPVYEKYTVPAPGKRGEKGERVTKYRPVK